MECAVCGTVWGRPMTGGAAGKNREMKRGYNSVTFSHRQQGRIQGGGSWGSGPPLLGTPKLHKEGKNAARVRAKRHILVLNSYPDPPLSEILYPPLGKPRTRQGVGPTGPVPYGSCWGTGHDHWHEAAGLNLPMIW